ncbi:transposase [Streptomyces sp. NPDC126510]|uniref:transposase n=1 Tax=Streptomyces sp. NPDC126510 TaxID=3155317 RepID=UPI003330C2FE
MDAAALTQAGFARLTALTPSSPCATAPDGVRERERPRAHGTAAPQQGDVRPSRRAFAVDGKCLRGAVRADGSRVFVLTSVRHDDTLTAALREIGAKTNEIPEFTPLLDQIDDTGLADAVVTVDALHAQKDHASYLVEQRHAHYLLSIKNNQPKLAGQLRRLPWKDVPVLHRSRDRGHGRDDILLSTGDEEIVEDTTTDHYRGRGRTGNGRNLLGRILVRTRHLLRAELAEALDADSRRPRP